MRDSASHVSNCKARTLNFLGPRLGAALGEVLLLCTSAGRWPVAGSQGAEADVEGFAHLKALEGQPQDERLLLGGSGGAGGGGLILSFLPFPPPMPSLPLPSLFSGIASCLHISTQIVLCKQSQSWCMESVLNPNAATYATATF